MAVVTATYTTDAHAQDLITKLVVVPSSVPNFSLQAGVLRYKDRIWVGQDSAVHKQLMTEFHASAYGGHSGFPVTYAKLKRYFTWSGMKTAVKSFVQSCAICQQAKLDRTK